MTSQPIRERYSPHHVLIFDDDWELLESMFDRNFGLRRIGTGKAIRDVLHHFCNRIRARENQAMSEAFPQPQPEPQPEPNLRPEPSQPAETPDAQ